MPTNISTETKSTLNAINAPESPVLAAIINHSALTSPVRVVNDNEGITIQGNYYQACAFDVVPPEDAEQVSPKATIEIDNIGQELMQWIEESRGGSGSEFTLLTVMRSRPDIVESSITLELDQISVTPSKVTATLGLEDMFGSDSCQMTFRPNLAPGIF